MSESLQDYNRMSWSGQDRGIYACHPYTVRALTYQEFTANGAGAVQGLQQRRPSYSDMALAGSLMTGSNDAIIKE